MQAIEELNSDVLIIGAGPAGLAAALYTARANKKTILLKGKQISWLEKAHLIENYPGAEPMPGSELLKKFEGQALSFGAEIIEGDALEVSLGYDPKMVTTRTHFITAKTVILAIGRGSHDKKIVREDNYVGLGLSYCATCDGAFFKSKKVVVYGNDKEAVDDAIMLQQLGCEVTFIPYCGKTKCPEEFLTLTKKAGITVIPNTEITECLGDSMLTGIKLKSGDDIITLDTEGLFIIKAMPSSAILEKAGIEISNKDCISVDRLMHTSVDGVYAAGDITCGGKQIATAVGDGVTAALEALKYLREKI